MAGLAALGVSSTTLPRALAQEPSSESHPTVQLPFENGERPLVAYPQKRPLIRLTSRPPQLETPFSIFNEGILTPNDAFFVRYHLAHSPPPMEKLEVATFRIQVQGQVKQPLSLSLADLKTQFEPAEIIAAHQCSGNSRGFFQPRVPGGQSGNGAMGNARWKGVRLKDVLQKAGLAAGAKQVLFNGADTPLMPTIPDFIKALEVDHALHPDLLIAWEMNGQPLPWLNGFPVRLIVPGHYGTYWIKHLNEITVVDSEFKGFWMNPAYRIPDDPCAHVEPGTTPKKTIPISRFNVRSFITSLEPGQKIESNKLQLLRGIAFDGGSGIREVLISDDQGQTWSGARLSEEQSRYSFREWTLPYTPRKAGEVTWLVRATNRLGESQPMEPLWNPAGYMRNVVERLTVVCT